MGVEQITTFVDRRLSAYCGYCDRVPSTRDHVPPKVLLDEPYPDNLPVVSTCAACNQEASLDEEYVACLLEIAACGTIDPADLERAKVSRILLRKPALLDRISAAVHKHHDGMIEITPEGDRVRRVLEKIARGLWTFETGETSGRAISSR